MVVVSFLRSTRFLAVDSGVVFNPTAFKVPSR